MGGPGLEVPEVGFLGSGMSTPSRDTANSWDSVCPSVCSVIALPTGVALGPTSFPIVSWPSGHSPPQGKEHPWRLKET